MIIQKVIRAASFAVFIGMLSSCSSVGNSVPDAMDDIKGVVKYPGSTLIYNVCHERWLRNGYKNYTFQVETGVYSAQSEKQKGVLSTVDVVNNTLSKVSACDLAYNGQSRECRSKSHRRLLTANTMNDYFGLWKKNPALYQSCHPVLGYPTGYGKTYGDRGRRMDAGSWLIISGLKPTGSSHSADNPAADASAPGMAGLPVRVEHASVNEMQVKLHSSRVSKKGVRHHLESSFEIANPTAKPAKVKITGWMLDASYKRYPLYVMSGGSAFLHIIPPHTRSTILYTSEGAPNVSLGRRTAAILEIESSDGVAVNLSLPNQ
ncbi:MAG: Unknown protein [uncultured Thiotrichaceae bacterium]|uniref:LTD domain-containing protein n=1 Tax=uncultured Thiotrichaceae bacterium TaxID=298394 RepID=A0A6S6U0B7_9GAMM|nr:MAG: Unknown protein [uncultured Thiotrichaceae bacterium]